MKKLSSILMVVLCLGLYGCGGEDSDCPEAGSACSDELQMMCCNGNAYYCQNNNGELAWGVNDCAQISDALGEKHYCDTYQATENYVWAECVTECDAEDENFYTLYSTECTNNEIFLWACLKADSGKYANFMVDIRPSVCWSESTALVCNDFAMAQEVTCPECENRDDGAYCAL